MLADPEMNSPPQRGESTPHTEILAPCDHPIVIFEPISENLLPSISV
jgi:hypothetical protein